MLQAFELMNQGKMNGFYIAQGFQPACGGAEQVEDRARFWAKLKGSSSWIRCYRNVRFWRNSAEFNDVDASKIQTGECSACRPRVLRKSAARW